jgi:phage shock protein A
MSIFRKLNTLLRAGARESAERITEANAIRIYKQELVDAENLLERRRACLAGIIATRKDLEKEISSAQQRIQRREGEIAGIEPDQRSDDLLMLAAKDIAGTEAHLANLRHRHLQVAERISREELTLRKLLTEIKEHRRELRILASEVARGGINGGVNYQQTVAGHLATLRETHASISGKVTFSDTAEDSMDEALERVDGDPLDRELATRGRDDASLRLANVLSRLREIGGPVPHPVR